MMSDYHLKIKIQNGRLKALMEEHGIKTQADLGRQVDLYQTDISAMLNLRMSLISKVTGLVNEKWLKLSEFFGCLPEDLVPEEFWNRQLKDNNWARDLSAAEMQTILPQQPEFLIEQLTDEEDKKKGLNKYLESSSLTDKEKTVIAMRFFMGKTLEQVGLKLNLCGQRVRQIEAKALWKLRAQGNKNKEMRDLRNELAVLVGAKEDHDVPRVYDRDKEKYVPRW